MDHRGAHHQCRLYHGGGLLAVRPRAAWWAFQQIGFGLADVVLIYARSSYRCGLWRATGKDTSGLLLRRSPFAALRQGPPPLSAGSAARRGRPKALAVCQSRTAGALRSCPLTPLPNDGAAKRSQLPRPTAGAVAGLVIAFLGLPLDAASNGDDHLASDVTVGEMTDGVGSLAQRVGPVYGGDDGLGLDQLAQDGEVLAALPRHEAPQVLADE